MQRRSPRTRQLEPVDSGIKCYTSRGWSRVRQCPGHVLCCSLDRVGIRVVEARVARLSLQTQLLYTNGSGVDCLYRLIIHRHGDLQSRSGSMRMSNVPCQRTAGVLFDCRTTACTRALRALLSSLRAIVGHFPVERGEAVRSSSPNPGTPGCGPKDVKPRQRENKT